ncbi:hypothetical protein GYMLUDRAFT_91193 [Collybiopsis luxurians FD-317 M1]|nr:hypothetical protein GYMLUDRAFT_91193 [Collybiopsis luxurians FD-317 M1]
MFRKRWSWHRCRFWMCIHGRYVARGDHFGFLFADVANSTYIFLFLTSEVRALYGYRSFRMFWNSSSVILPEDRPRLFSKLWTIEDSGDI